MEGLYAILAGLEPDLCGSVAIRPAYQGSLSARSWPIGPARSEFADRRANSLHEWKMLRQTRLVRLLTHHVLAAFNSNLSDRGSGARRDYGYGLQRNPHARRADGAAGFEEGWRCL